MSLQVFKFNQNDIQVLTSENGEPLFIAKEVCEVLNIINSRQAIANLDEDEKLLYTLYTAGQNRQINVITESGLYSLVLRSNKPEAKAFKKWVTSEVLPAIRKHGMYATAPTLEQMIANPDTIIQLATALKEERQQKELLAEQNRLQQNQLKLTAPKVEYYETVLQSESTYNTNQIAKELGLSAVTLNRKLHELGIQYKQNDQWLLYYKYQNLGYTKTKTASFTGSDGETRTTMSTVWTEKGRKFIHDLLKQRMQTA